MGKLTDLLCTQIFNIIFIDMIFTLTSVTRNQDGIYVAEYYNKENTMMMRVLQANFSDILEHFNVQIVE